MDKLEDGCETLLANSPTNTINISSNRTRHLSGKWYQLIHSCSTFIPSFVTIINPVVATSRRPTVKSRGFGSPDPAFLLLYGKCTRHINSIDIRYYLKEKCVCTRRFNSVNISVNWGNHHTQIFMKSSNRVITDFVSFSPIEHI